MKGSKKMPVKKEAAMIKKSEAKSDKKMSKKPKGAPSKKGY